MTHSQPGSGERLIDDSRFDGVPDALTAYRRQANAYPRLSPEQEIEFGLLVQAGQMAQRSLETGEYDALEESRLDQEIALGLDAEARFIKANLRLVIDFANRMKMVRPSISMPLIDLIQEGNAGLIHAVRKFDPNRGVKFSTYAAYWINNALVRAVQQTDRLIRYPELVEEAISEIYMRAALFRQEFGREPTQTELADACDLTLAKLDELLEYDLRHISFDAPDGPGRTAWLALTDRPHNDEQSPRLRPGEIEAALHLAIDALMARRQRNGARAAQLTRQHLGLDQDGLARTFAELGDLHEATPSSVQMVVRRFIAELAEDESLRKLLGDQAVVG